MYIFLEYIKKILKERNKKKHTYKLQKWLLVLQYEYILLHIVYHDDD